MEGLEESVDLKDSSEVISVREAMVGTCEGCQTVYTPDWYSRIPMSAWKYRYLVESASWSTTYILITNLQMLSQSEIAMTPHSRYRQALSAVSSPGQRPATSLSSHILEKDTSIVRSTNTSFNFEVPPQILSESDFASRLIMSSARD